MTFLARVSVTLALVAGTTLAGAWAVPAPACAGAGARAVLVVDTGEAEQRMCVALPRPQVSGADLIVLAGEQHGLSYRFGYGGGAVCMLAGVGTSGDDCFEKYPDFWGYWRGNGSGGWSWSSTGAGSTRVSNGDVEGWSWGRGTDGSSHPAPPPTSFSSVCPAAAPPPSTTGGSRPRQAPSGDPEGERDPVAPGRAAGARGVSGDEGRAVQRSTVGRRNEVQASRGRTGRRRAVVGGRPRGMRLPEDALDTAVAADRGSGPRASGLGDPPPAGIAALAGAVAMAGAARWAARRRRLRP